MKDKNIKKQHSAQALSTDNLENVAGGRGQISYTPDYLYTEYPLSDSQKEWLLQNDYNLTFTENDTSGAATVTDSKGHVLNIFSVDYLLKRNNIT